MCVKLADSEAILTFYITWYGMVWYNTDFLLSCFFFTGFCWGKITSVDKNKKLLPGILYRGMFCIGMVSNSIREQLVFKYSVSLYV